MRLKATARGNAAAAVRRAPEALAQHIGWALERAAQEVAREERRQAPKATSQLTNSIRAERIGAFEWRVAPHTDYAGYVEGGTRGGGGMPPVRMILDWVKTVGITPRDPSMAPEDLAWAIARSIQSSGTPAQPFVAPTRAAMRDRVFALMRGGVRDGVAAAARA